MMTYLNDENSRLFEGWRIWNDKSYNLFSITITLGEKNAGSLLWGPQVRVFLQIIDSNQMKKT